MFNYYAYLLTYRHKKSVELHLLASQVPPSTSLANKYSPRRRRRRITYYYASFLKLAVLRSKIIKLTLFLICNAIVATIDKRVQE